MNAVSNTPEFWARSEAAEIVRDMPERELSYLADSLEASAASYDGTPEFVALIVAVLRRRATAGLRFWPVPEADARANATLGIELEDDQIPW